VAEALAVHLVHRPDKLGADVLEHRGFLAVVTRCAGDGWSEKRQHGAEMTAVGPDKPEILNGRGEGGWPRVLGRGCAGQEEIPNF
jgi:hypothetical protein